MEHEEDLNKTHEDVKSVELKGLKPLTPYSYPIWILCFGYIIIFISGYSFYLLPTYFSAAKNMRLGEVAYQNKDYQMAIKSLENTLLEVPSSRTTRITLAKAYFLTQSRENYIVAFECLKGITFKGQELTDVLNVVPKEYHCYFESVKA